MAFGERVFLRLLEGDARQARFAMNGGGGLSVYYDIRGDDGLMLTTMRFLVTALF